MGSTVRLLDETLIDQIAAGEVIERPASLVKELVENAIDARATSITVALEDGGRGRVRVADDGIGMSREDATLSIERHATSKIARFEDLTRIGTLGFRGEALPSIGSVSRMTITTRPREDLEGTRLVVEGGELRDVGPVGCPPGTTVEVDDLFYNVPARRKFLRARQTESSRIFETCQRIALGRPSLRMVVTSDGRIAREYLPARTLAERARQIFGDIPLREIHAKRDELELDAALAPSAMARPGARQLFLLVNGRPVVDRALARAVAFAFGDALPPGHYPRGVVALRLPSEDVDVNAHPQKTEVRFRESARLVDRVTRMLAAHLPAESRTAAERYWEQRLAKSPSAGIGPAPAEVAQAESPYEARPFPRLRLLMQVRDRALVCESPDAIVVIDRERADALRRSEALERDAEAASPPQQKLLFPDRLQLSLREQQSLADHEPLLRSLGFDWSKLGEDSFAVRSVPAAIADAAATRALSAALETLADTKGSKAALIRALGRVSAAPNGAPIADEQARRIVGAIEPESDAHRPCIIARIPLPDTEPNADDG